MAIIDPNLQDVVQSTEPVITTTETFVAPDDPFTPIVSTSAFITNPDEFVEAEEEFQALQPIAPIEEIQPEPPPPTPDELLLEPIAPLPELEPLPPPPPTPEELESQLELSPDLIGIAPLPEIQPEAPPPTPSELEAQIQNLESQLSAETLLGDAGLESLQGTIGSDFNLDNLTSSQLENFQELQSLGLADQSGLVDISVAISEGKRELLLGAGFTDDQISDTLKKQSATLRDARNLLKESESVRERDTAIRNKRVLAQIRTLKLSDPISGENIPLVFDGGSVNVPGIIAASPQGRNLLKQLGFDDTEIDGSIAENNQIQRLARQFARWEEADAPARAIMDKNRKLGDIDAVIASVEAKIQRKTPIVKKDAEEFARQSFDFSTPPGQSKEPESFSELRDLTRLKDVLESDRKAIEEFRLTSTQAINPDTGEVFTGSFFTTSVPDDLKKLQEDSNKELAGTKGAARFGIGVNIGLLPFDARNARRNDLVNTYVYTAQHGGMTWEQAREGIEQIPSEVTMEDWNEVKIRIAERALILSPLMGPAGIAIAGAATGATWNDRTEGQRALDIGLLLLSAIPSGFTIHAAARQTGRVAAGTRAGRAQEILVRATNAELDGLQQLVRRPWNSTANIIKLGIINPTDAAANLIRSQVGRIRGVPTGGTRLLDTLGEKTTLRISAEEALAREGAIPLPDSLWQQVKLESRPRATVIIEDPDRGVMVVKGKKKDDHWILPGGGLDGDLPAFAAQKELAEELGVQATELVAAGKYNGFGSSTDWRGRPLEHNIFEARGLTGTPKPSSEIGDIAFWKPGNNLELNSGIKLSDDTREILEARSTGRAFAVNTVGKDGTITPEAIHEAVIGSTKGLATTGKKTPVAIKDVFGRNTDYVVEIEPNAMHRATGKGASFSATPDDRGLQWAMESGEEFVVGSGLLWNSTRPHSRFFLNTSSGKAIDWTRIQSTKQPGLSFQDIFDAKRYEKRPAVMMFKGEILNDLETAGLINTARGDVDVAYETALKNLSPRQQVELKLRRKMYHGVAESELVFPEGTNLGIPKQRLTMKDSSGQNVQVYVFGDELTRAEIANLNIRAPLSAVNTIVEPPIKLRFTGESLTRQIDDLTSQMKQATRAGDTVEAERLRKQIQALTVTRDTLIKESRDLFKPKVVGNESDSLEEYIDHQVRTAERLQEKGYGEAAFQAAEEAALTRQAQVAIFPNATLAGVAAPRLVPEAPVDVSRRSAIRGTGRRAGELGIGEIRVPGVDFGRIETGITSEVTARPPRRRVDTPDLERLPIRTETERPLTSEGEVRPSTRRTPRRPRVTPGKRPVVPTGERPVTPDTRRPVTPEGERPTTLPRERPTTPSERPTTPDPGRTRVPDPDRARIPDPDRVSIPDPGRVSIPDPGRIRVPDPGRIRTPTPDRPKTPGERITTRLTGRDRPIIPPDDPRIPFSRKTPIPSLGQAKTEDVKRFRLPPEAVTWRQGFVWVTVLPPYTQDKIFFTRSRMPKTRKFRNPFEAFRRIEQIIGGTVDPETLDEWASLFQSARDISDVREIIR